MDTSSLLEEISSIRRSTQRDLSGGTWRWLLLWAAVCGGFVITLAWPQLHGVSHWYWAFGVPLGLIATVLVDQFNSDADHRVRRREWPYWATAAAITALNTAGSFWLDGDWMLVGLWIVLSGGFAVLLRLEGERQASRALGSLAGIFLFIGLVVDDPLATSVTYGSVFVLVLLCVAWAGRR